MRKLTMLGVSVPLLALTAAVNAQAPSHTRTTPKVFTGHYAPNSSFLPLARTGGRMQVWYRGDNLPASLTITALGLRPDENASSSGGPQSLEVTVSSTPKGFGDLGRNFANNHGPDKTTFFARRTINLPPVYKNSNPDQPAFWIMGDNPFAYRGPHLVVELDMGPAAGSTYRFGYMTDSVVMGDSLFTTSERSCANASLSGAFVGADYVLSLQGTPANSSAVLVIGVDNTRLGGVVPLPWDLTGLGMTGCVLGVDPLVTLNVTTSGIGSYTFTATTGLPASSAVLHAQALHQTPVTPAGWGTTNVANGVIGKAGLCNWLYNWTADGPNAEFGPYDHNNGLVLLIQP